MRLQELFDIFESTYKIECLKAGVKEIALTKKIEAFCLSNGIQDILREVKEFERYVDLENVDGVVDYVLPDDFGFVINVTANGKPLAVTSRDAIKVAPYQNTAASKFAIYPFTKETEIVPVAGVVVAPTTGSLGAGTGETLQLTTTISPANATNKTVLWTSNTPTRATANSNGLVTEVGNYVYDVDTITITATTVDGGFTNTCVITIEYAG
jgi:hypothetical protein